MTRPDDADEPRDAWLHEALHHAPDAQDGPPAALREAILRQAREATRPRLGRRLAQAWSRLASPPFAAALASLALATVIIATWRDSGLEVPPSQDAVAVAPRPAAMPSGPSQPAAMPSWPSQPAEVPGQPDAAADARSGDIVQPPRAPQSSAVAPAARSARPSMKADPTPPSKAVPAPSMGGESPRAPTAEAPPQAMKGQSSLTTAVPPTMNAESPPAMKGEPPPPLKPEPPRMTAALPSGKAAAPAASTPLPGSPAASMVAPAAAPMADASLPRTETQPSRERRAGAAATETSTQSPEPLRAAAQRLTAAALGESGGHEPPPTSALYWMLGPRHVAHGSAQQSWFLQLQQLTAGRWRREDTALPGLRVALVDRDAAVGTLVLGDDGVAWIEAGGRTWIAALPSADAARLADAVRAW